MIKAFVCGLLGLGVSCISSVTVSTWIGVVSLVSGGGLGSGGGLVAGSLVAFGFSNISSMHTPFWLRCSSASGASSLLSPWIGSMVCICVSLASLLLSS